MTIFGKKPVIPDPEEALAGRETPIHISGIHYVTGNSMLPPFPAQLTQAMFGLGCFWGAEKKFWELNGVYSTAAGYSAGFTPNPSYQEVCSGLTGHNEVVLVIFDESLISYKRLLKCFWESHNPTEGMRQGNDVGTQYRSGIYTFSDLQYEQANRSRDIYQAALNKSTDTNITTEIKAAAEFYYAEEYHQQYLAKNINGYCGLGGSGVLFSDELMDTEYGN